MNIDWLIDAKYEWCLTCSKLTISFAIAYIHTTESTKPAQA